MGGSQERRSSYPRLRLVDRALVHAVGGGTAHLILAVTVRASWRICSGTRCCCPTRRCSLTGKRDRNGVPPREADSQSMSALGRVLINWLTKSARSASAIRPTAAEKRTSREVRGVSITVTRGA